MPNKKVYFGTLDDMQWVPAPQANSTYNRVSWRASGTFLNGGGYQRQSSTSHKELSLAWSVQQLEMIDKVLAQFNKGEMLYYIDPIAAKYNVLPPYVAQYQPDNPQGVGFVDTGGAGALGYPRKAAVYNGANTLATVPVPAGQNLWVGAHGNAIGGGGVAVAGDDSGTPEVLSTRTNLVQNGRAKYTSGTVEVRRNYFTYATTTAGWSNDQAFAQTYVEDPRFPSGRAVKVQKPAGSASTFAVYSSDPNSNVIPVGKSSFTYSVYVLAEADCVVRTRVAERVGSANPGPVQYGPYVTIQANVPTRLVYTLTPSSTTDSLSLGIVSSWGDIATNIFVSSPLVEIGSVVSDYFDGSYSPDPDLTPSWTGTANASASVLTAPALTGNFIVTGASMIFQSTQWDERPTSVRLTTKNAGSNMSFFSNFGAKMGDISAAAVLLHIPQDISDSSRIPYIYLEGSFGEQIGSPVASRQAGTYLLTVAGQQAGNYRSLYFCGPSGIDTYWSDAIAVKGYDTAENALAAVQTYFDGDTANKQDGLVITTYTWDGTAGQASSTETVTYNPNATVPVLMLPTSNVQRVNTKVQGGQNLTISTTGDGSVQLNGLIAQILPEGETPEPGGFVSGQGHSGLRLNSDPMVTQYSVSIPNAQIGMSADFIETGAWE